MSTLVKFINSGHGEFLNWGPVTLHAAQTTSFTQPTALGGGGEVVKWINGQGYGPDLANIEITGSAAATITGPVALYAERRGKVYFVGLMNYGQDIVLQGADVGFSQVIAGVGGAERLLLGGVTGAALISTGTIAVRAYPVATKEV